VSLEYEKIVRHEQRNSSLACEDCSVFAAETCSSFWLTNYYFTGGFVSSRPGRVKPLQVVRKSHTALQTSHAKDWAGVDGLPVSHPTGL